MKYLYLIFAIALFSTANAQQNTEGILDTTFNHSGYVISQFDSTARASDMAIQSDGKILVTGQTTAYRIYIERYNADGSPDVTFDNDGIVEYTLPSVSNLYAKYIEALPNGKFYVVGRWGDYIQGGNYIARFNNNGSIDNTFGDDGFMLEPAQSASSIVIEDFKVQPDGKMLMAGFKKVLQTGKNIDLKVERYNSDGSKDAGFGVNGTFTLDIDTVDKGMEIELQPDGKILIGGVAGWDSFPPGQTSGQFVPILSMVIARLNSNGELDNTFGNGGVVYKPHFHEANYCLSLAIRTNGNIIATGNYSYLGCAFLIAYGLTSTGQDDTSFGQGGRYTETNHVLVNISAIGTIAKPDGKVLFVGSTTVMNTPGLHFCIYGVLPNATPDHTIGNNDSLAFQFFDYSSSEAARGVALQADGKIVIAGQSYYNGKYRFCIARYTNSGMSTTVNTEPALPSKLSIYPNPSNGTFNLTANAEKQGVATIELISTTGAKVFEQKINIGKGDNIISIQANVVQGFYLMRMLGNEGISVQKVSIGY